MSEAEPNQILCVSDTFAAEALGAIRLSEPRERGEHWQRRQRQGRGPELQLSAYRREKM